MQEETLEQEISLQEIMDFIREHILSFIVSAILGAALAYSFMTFFIAPTYESQAQLLVNQSTQEEEPIQGAQIQANVQLINTYQDIIRADSTLTKVNEALGGSYTVAELREVISVEQRADSQAFIIHATMESPNEAQNVLASVVTVFEEQVKEAYSTNDPNIFILSPANFNPDPVAPSALMYLAIGGLLGLMLSFAYHLIRYVADTRIRDTEFVDSLGLIKLGEINTIPDKMLQEMRLTNVSDDRRTRRKV